MKENGKIQTEKKGKLGLKKKKKKKNKFQLDYKEEKMI